MTVVVVRDVLVMVVVLKIYIQIRKGLWGSLCRRSICMCVCVCVCACVCGVWLASCLRKVIVVSCFVSICLFVCVFYWFIFIISCGML